MPGDEASGQTSTSEDARELDLPCSQSSHGSAVNKLQHSLANAPNDAGGDVLKNYAVTNNLHEKDICKTYRGLRLSLVAFHLAF